MRNAGMRFVVDPWNEDQAALHHGSVSSASGGHPNAAFKSRTDSAAHEAEATDSMIKTFRTLSDRLQEGGKAGNSKLNISAWKGVAGDDHVPGQ